ncbi:MAG: hypothetical protein GY854_14320 [Deltaproteobacteria bacterium]|nr:hypothetical protein [Deltaproteobacteria bacterium]
MKYNKKTTGMSQLAALWLGLISIFAASDLCAGGLFFPDVGTVSLGRGAAFVAKADNLSAFYYNPAGLSKSKGVNILGGANFIDLNATFLRTGTGVWEDLGLEIEALPGLVFRAGNPDLDFADGIGNERPYSRVSQQTPVTVTGVLGALNWGDAFGVEGLALAIGVYAPSSFNKPKYPSDGAQRYAIREMSTFIIMPGPAVSYAFNRYIQVGAVFLSGMGFVNKRWASRLAPAIDDLDWNEDLDGDVDIQLEVKDLFMPSGIFGVLSNPLDWLEIGAAVKLPVYMAAEGKLKITPSEVDYPEAEIIEETNKVTVRQHFPWMVSTGVRYIHRVFDIEVDFVWENWSTYQAQRGEVGTKITLDKGDTSEDPNNENKEDDTVKDMPNTEIPKNYRDTYSVRVGSDVEVWKDNLTVRLGGYYQSSAYPENNNTFNLDFPFGEQFGTGCGLSWHTFDFLTINIGYLHIFQAPVEVEGGTVQQTGTAIVATDIGLPEDAMDPVYIGNMVNNGRYETNLNIFSASIEGHF